MFLAASVTNCCCSYPAADCLDTFAPFVCLPSYLLHEVTESEVGDFTSPQAHHALEAEIFKEAEVKPTDEGNGKLPMVVFALALDSTINSGVIYVKVNNTIVWTIL